MSKQFNVAVVGATGLVGETMIQLLEERNFPVAEFHPLASERSAGAKIRFGRREHTVGVLDDFDFSGTDIAMFSAGGSISDVHAPRAGDAGCVVIDNGDDFRMDERVPLVIPEINPQALQGHQGIQGSRHHCQPQLLDDPDAGRAQSVTKRGRNRADRYRYLPVGVGSGAYTYGGAGESDRDAPERQAR